MTRSCTSTRARFSSPSPPHLFLFYVTGSSADGPPLLSLLPMTDTTLSARTAKYSGAEHSSIRLFRPSHQCVPKQQRKKEEGKRGEGTGPTPHVQMYFDPPARLGTRLWPSFTF